MDTIKETWTRRIRLLCLLLITLFLAPQVLAGAEKHQPIVEQLETLLSARPDLKDALEAAIAKAGRPGILSLDEYYRFLDDMVTLIPTNRNLFSTVMEFYYIVDQSPKLHEDDVFNRWMVKFAADWGSFLDTPASAQGLASFYTQPQYHIHDYQEAPSGWLTYNQFFARNIKPGKRPIAAPCDDRIIVSPADSVFAGQWPITDDAHIEVKGIRYSIADLLAGSPYQDRFRGGTFAHSFLNVNDYHHYHVPVGGKILEARTILGRVALDVVKMPDGSLNVVEGTGGTGYQFRQARGLLVIDSPVGLVAVLPIGMAQVSSVNITAEEGVTLTKGEQFGYFLFGGSDIILLFEPNRVEITAREMTHYRQGEQFAVVAQ